MQQVILNVFTEIIASILYRLPNYTFQIVGVLRTHTQNLRNEREEQ